MLQKTILSRTSDNFIFLDSLIYNSIGKVDTHYYYCRKIQNIMNDCNSRYKYKYNTSGDIVEKLFQQKPTGPAPWVNNRKTTYTYNTSNELIEEFFEIYNSSTSSWMNAGKITYVYSSGKRTYKVHKEYISGAWVTNDSLAYIYNTNGTLKEEYFSPVNRALYFYSPTTGIDDISTVNSIKIYPNPTSGRFIIELGDMEPSAITITDITGKQVYTAKTSGDLDIDLTDLHKGIYLVNIKSGATSSTQKIVVQ